MSVTSSTTALDAPGAPARESAGWIDRFIDRLNPILVKETRQAVKSKQFFGAFLSLLLVSWLISVISVSAAGQQLDFGTWGRDLFASYFVVLAAAILVFVPFGAYRSLMLERDEATFEPLIISTLTPRRIVRGKLLSAVVQTFLFYSAIAPFVAFTALLQGFDIVYVSVLLLLGIGVSLWASNAALAVSAMVHSRTLQTLAALAVLFGLMFVFGTMWSMAFETWWLRWSDPWMIAGFAAWVVAGLANIVLLQEVAVANLTFASDNRSTGLRVISEAHFVLLWLMIAAAVWYFGGLSGSDFHELLLLGVVLGSLFWTAMGLFFVTEADCLSQRLIRQLPPSRLLRLLLTPFYPGGHRGLILLLGNILVLATILVWIGRRPSVGLQSDAVLLCQACLLYLVIYLNFGAALSRWAMARSPVLTPLHCRVATLLLIGLSMAAPLFVLLLDGYGINQRYSLLWLPNPGITLNELGRSRDSAEVILTLLAAGALLTTAVNIPAMWRGTAEMFNARPRSLETPGAAAGE